MNTVRSFIKEQSAFGAIIALLAILITAAVVTFSTNVWVTNLGLLALLFLGMAVIASKVRRGTNVAKRTVKVEMGQFSGIGLIK